MAEVKPPFIFTLSAGGYYARGYYAKVAELLKAIEGNPEAKADFEGWRFLAVKEETRDDDEIWMSARGPWTCLSGLNTNQIPHIANHDTHPIRRRIEKAWHEL